MFAIIILQKQKLNLALNQSNLKKCLRQIRMVFGVIIPQKRKLNSTFNQSNLTYNFGLLPYEAKQNPLV